MKPFAAQSYYELLEVSVSATAPEIRAAWERLNRMYADDQLALYGLANAGSAAELRKRLKEAMEVLTDDELRGMYDEEIGLPPRALHVEPTPPVVTNQIEMGDLLAGVDQSATHPRVAFTYASEGDARPDTRIEAKSSPSEVEGRASEARKEREAAEKAAEKAAAEKAAAEKAAAEKAAAEKAAAEKAAAEKAAAEAATQRPSTQLGELPPAAPSAPAPSAPSAHDPAQRPSTSLGEQLAAESAIALVPRASPKPAGIPPPPPSAPRLPDPPADAEYNGELLRQRRTAMGFSLQTVAERTRIGAKHLENVEADRYAALPATVYLRGILMSLAKELRLDGLKVSRSYLALVERNKPSKG